MDDFKINDSTVIVRNADKGRAVVLLNCDDYVTEIQGQLNTTTFYQKLSRDPTPLFKDEIHCKLKSLLENGEIMQKEYEFMKVDNPIRSVIHALPKIHKLLDKPPGRPIVASIG